MAMLDINSDIVYIFVDG